MTVSLVQWRGIIGIFNYQSLGKPNHSIYETKRNHISLIKSLSCCCHCFEKVYVPLFTLLYILVPLKYHGNVDLNPGQKYSRKISSLSAIGILVL